MDLIFFLKLFSTIALRTLKISKNSDLCFIKYIQHNLEKSLIKVRKYLKPLMDVVDIGPATSLCIKSSIDTSLCAFPTSYLFYGCIPTTDEKQTFNHFIIMELLEIFEIDIPKSIMPYLVGVASMSQ